ncbi:hypothetical protein RUND412_001419 [Rhizina undulata]
MFGLQSEKSMDVKCDERPESCLNCQKLEVECPGYAARPPDEDSVEAVEIIFEKAGVKRRRMAGSCKECRESKSRCSGAKPKCERCVKRKLACDYNFRLSSEGANSSYKSSSEKNYSPGSSPRTAQNELSIDALSPNLQDRNSNWLYSPSLTEDTKLLRQLVDTYFSHIHPLRCLSFIHKPSFMRALEEKTIEKVYGEHVLLIMCALAARVIACDEKDPSQDVSKILLAGHSWARKAQSYIFSDLNNFSVVKLMTTVLLCVYEEWGGHHSAAFLLSASVVRAAQALMLNIEHDEDILCKDKSRSIDATTKESRRRLMWSCFTLDLQMCSGVKYISLLDASTLKLQLPCQERNYSLQIPCITEKLDPGLGLMCASDNLDNPGRENLGIEAFYVRLLYIRGKILRYIREPTTYPLPWMEGSKLLQITQELECWRASLPENMEFNDSNIYIRKTQDQLSAFFAIHFLFHHCFCDLYRIILPGWHFPATPTFEGSPESFIPSCQNFVNSHAAQISNILASGLKHGRIALEDPMSTMHAYESTKIQVIYLLACCPNKARKSLWPITAKNVDANFKALEFLKPFNWSAGLCISSLNELLGKLNLSEITNQQTFPYLRSADMTTEVHPLDLENLHPFAPFRLARETLKDKHYPTPVVTPPRTWRPWSPPVDTIEPLSASDSNNSRNRPESHHPRSRSIVASPEEEIRSNPETQNASGSTSTTEIDLIMEDFTQVFCENRDLLIWDPMFGGVTDNDFGALPRDLGYPEMSGSGLGAVYRCAGDDIIEK